MKKLGLFFGTFDPLHNGHVEIGNYFIKELQLDELRFIVTPHNPFKKIKEISSDEQRLKMVSKFCEKQLNVVCSRVEFDLPKPNYTSETLAYINQKNPNSNLYVILGEDNLNNLDKWKDYQKILGHQICVYPRKNQTNVKSKLIDHKMIKLYKAPLKDISSTLIRERIKNGISIKDLVPNVIYMEYKNFSK